MTYFVKSLTLFSFSTGEQTGETFYSDIFIHVKSKYYVKNTSPPSPPLGNSKTSDKVRKALEPERFEGFFASRVVRQNPMKNGSQTGQQTGQLARTCYSPPKVIR